jgi:uncharacterized membrane protein
MSFDGIIIGAAAFVIIGVFHPVVIKGEYFFGVRIWPLFLFLGIGVLVLALFADVYIVRAVLGVTGFTLLWSIKEIFEQAERVKKGWFPKNPSRRKRK